MSTATHPEHSAEMPFLDHVRELRTRMYWCLIGLGVAFLVTYLTYDSYISYFITPFTEVLTKLGHETSMVIRTLTEAFVTKLQFSLIAAIILSFPLHLYQFLAFVIPALTKKEKRILGWILTAGGGLFLAGISMAYFVVLPLCIEFLLSNDLVVAGASVQIDFQRNLMFAAKMLLAFAALFQLPLVLVVMMAFDIVKRDTLLKFSRYFIVLIFVASAIMTPPDIISQVALALPLIVLFYLSILVAKICGFGNPDPD